MSLFYSFYSLELLLIQCNFVGLDNFKNLAWRREFLDGLYEQPKIRFDKRCASSRYGAVPFYFDHAGYQKNKPIL